ncbi:MAG: hypothetical protein KJS98_00435 [Nitrospirae bacterium]|nr:hypothetical protein [Nitrospirota bacterium]
MKSLVRVEPALATMDSFLAGDGSIEFPDHRATFWYGQATGNVFRRFDARPACGYIARLLHSFIYQRTRPRVRPTPAEDSTA